MKAYRIASDGDVTIHEGDEDFWMDGSITYSEVETPRFPGNTIFYDDESFLDPGEVRLTIAGVEVPTPAWFMGVDGEDTCDPTVSPDTVRASIKIPS